MALRVVLHSGELEARTELVFDGARIVIGRGRGADLQLPDPSVSLRHASLRFKQSGYVLVDEDSENGTFVDQERLGPQTPMRLVGGEFVRLGRVWLELHQDAMATASTAAEVRALPERLVARALVLEGESPTVATRTAAEVLSALRQVPTELLGDQESHLPPRPAPQWQDFTSIDAQTKAPAARAENSPAPRPSSPLGRLQLQMPSLDDARSAAVGSLHALRDLARSALVEPPIRTPSSEARIDWLLMSAATLIVLLSAWAIVALSTSPL